MTVLAEGRARFAAKLAHFGPKLDQSLQREVGHDAIVPRPAPPPRRTGFRFQRGQAQGTLGRRLVDGAKRVRIFSQEIPVRAAIHTLGGFSAHADQPALLAWTAGFRRPPRRTFVVHGEETAALAFAERLRSERGWTVMVPEPGQSVRL